MGLPDLTASQFDSIQASVQQVLNTSQRQREREQASVKCMLWTEQGCTTVVTID